MAPPLALSSLGIVAQNKNGAAESQASRVAATVLRELNDTRTRQRAQCVFRTYLKIPRVRDRSIWAQF